MLPFAPSGGTPGDSDGNDGSHDVPRLTTLLAVFWVSFVLWLALIMNLHRWEQERAHERVRQNIQRILDEKQPHRGF